MKLLSIIFASILFFIFPVIAFAVENPLSVPNNKVGIHVLFPEEIGEAARLVNANGGDWGYVTIPIQAGDKNLLKWQKFMDAAKQNHVIPIVRLATEGDYFNTIVWRKPEASDVLDFANFLDSLDWPTKNRYIIVFNEVNRGDEWGGTPSPAQYADILAYSAVVFKAKSSDFFIISAGLDNAAANTPTSYNQYDYLRTMHSSIPDIFDQIDGLGSHSYPNPGFNQPPSNQSRTSIASFRFEEDFVQNLSGKSLPIFITETGWSLEAVSEEVAGVYFGEAFLSVWNQANVVVVTPFLLRAHAGPFRKFSFLNDDSSPRSIYRVVFGLPKIKGAPILSPDKPFDQKPKNQVLGLRNFSAHRVQPTTIDAVPSGIKMLFMWLLKI